MKFSKRGAMVMLALVAGLLPPMASRADTIAVDFDAYASGSIHGQDGWSSSGSLPGGLCPGQTDEYDHEVTAVPRPLVPEFGEKSLRISNSVVTPLDPLDCISNQTFSKEAVNEAGEAGALNHPLDSGGVRLGHFEASWELVTALPSYEPGLQMDFSPDRGDGTRMSLLSIDDTIPGLTLTFTDYKSGSSLPGCSDLNFRTTNLGSPSVIILDRFPATHEFKMSMDLFAGPGNDVVKVFVNGELVHTGTSWEDFYRECQGGLTRTVDSMLFRTGGVEGLDDCVECEEGGFFIDNLIIKTGGVRVIATGPGLTVTEGGPCDSYTLSLEEPPAPGTTVTVTASHSGDITVSPMTFVFTSANWNIPQTVTVCAIDDTTPELPHTVLIHHTVTSTDPTWDGTAVPDMPVLVLDNDGPFVIIQSGGSTNVVEGGATDSYTMHLTRQPTANVTVPVSPDVQVTTSTGSLVFTPSNWNIPHVVTVAAVDDLVDEPSPHLGIISHGPSSSADPTYNGLPVPSVTAFITDNDPVDVIPPPTPLINCPGATITTSSFSLTGTAEPGSTVTVFINGQTWGSAPSDSMGNWRITLTFTSNGSYTITAQARDGAGNLSPISIACVITVVADFTPPAAPVITSPVSGFTGRCVTFTVTFDTDADRLLVFDNGTLILTVNVNPPPSPFSTQLCFTSGVHRLTVIAVDAAGNRSPPSNTVTITVDAEPPTVRINKPSGYLLMQISIFNDPVISGIANDLGSGVDRIELSYEPLLPLLGEALAVTATCPACPSGPNVTVDWFNNPDLTPGLYSVTATAYDLVGNSATADDLLLFIF